MCNAAHPAVLETAAVAVAGPSGGPEQLHMVVVLKKAEEKAQLGEVNLDEGALRASFNKAIQKKLNPLFKVQLDARKACVSSSMPL